MRRNRFTKMITTIAAGCLGLALWTSSAAAEPNFLPMAKELTSKLGTGGRVPGAIWRNKVCQYDTTSIRNITNAGFDRLVNPPPRQPASVGEPYVSWANAAQPLPYSHDKVPGPIRFNASRLGDRTSIDRVVAAGFEIYKQRMQGR